MTERYYVIENMNGEYLTGGYFWRVGNTNIWPHPEENIEAILRNRRIAERSPKLLIPVNANAEPTGESPINVKDWRLARGRRISATSMNFLRGTLLSQITGGYSGQINQGRN